MGEDPRKRMSLFSKKKPKGSEVSQAQDPDQPKVSRGAVRANRYVPGEGLVTDHDPAPDPAQAQLPLGKYVPGVGFVQEDEDPVIIHPDDDNWDQDEASKSSKFPAM